MNKFDSVLVFSVFAVLLICVVSFSYADYLSPKKQLESGILPEDVMCREGKVLVYRDNGGIACVRESTADKMNWEIVQNNNSIQIDSKTSVDNYNKGYLKNLETLDYETDDGNIFSAPSPYFSGWSKAEISKIPKLGDVFEITVTAQADPPIITSHNMGIAITEQFEFVKDSLPENVKFTTPELGRTDIDFFTDDVETGSQTIQVRAIKEGYGFIFAGARYQDADERILIYVDKDNSFYYDEGDEPTVNFVPLPQYGIDYADMVRIQEENSVDSSFIPDVFITGDDVVASSSSSNAVTEKQIRDLALNDINFADYMDNKSYYWDMLQAKNIKTTVKIPQTISVGSTETIRVTLESINRTSDYEHVLIDVGLGPGIQLDVKKIEDPNCVNHCEEKYNVYNNDLFAIGADNTLTVDYPIKATKAGTWMLNFVVNGEFERHVIVVVE